MFGRNEQGNELVYIGEAEVVLDRLNQHLAKKDFWYETIVFTSKDENLNKAHIKFLENRIYELAKSARRYTVLNEVTPTRSAISEPDQAEMQEFIENVRLLLNTLGHKVLEEKRESHAPYEQTKSSFVLKGPRGVDAQGEPTAEGFVVFQGSKASLTAVPSFPDTLNQLRTRLVAENKLQQTEEAYVFTEDFIFSSPSTAASVILGRSANGQVEWKTATGIALKQYESISLPLSTENTNSPE
ncbi:GIY-YIG nuclease family protein [Spirosoma sp. RP8]|uniref:GIY-YIG nuclease family protein n=1 Tax=Spirosoma liriopis TaxID=2937440 RepID=A0ABT0HP74_9BACT|nr:GIY-YIG nuclease family protein [Spirosoma liriopis]MCK8493978.1 GIY-YIG nuclease family protein [Spirosoma liriopis]